MITSMDSSLTLVTYCLLLSTCLAMPSYNRNRFACPATSNCSCNFIESNIEVECPPFEPEITVSLQPTKYVQIECQTSSDRVYEKLPAMQLGNISMVRFKRCPPPSGSSYHAVLGHLGIGNTRTLFVENGGSSMVRQHFTGFRDLERLHINGKEMSEMPDDLFDDVKQIRWLSLRSNNLDLPVNIFRSLEKLENIELGHNSLTSLTPGIFSNQHQLKNLNLWGNDLRNLTKAELNGVTSIQELDLSANLLESLEAGVFDQMANLTDINLSSNPLVALPEGLFAANQNLTRIRLLNNKVPMLTLPSRLLANLTRLDSVSISCGLSSLPDDLFADSVNVKNITFSGNSLQTLPVGLFVGLVSVLEVDLSKNKLQRLDDGVFEQLEAVRVLRLSQNQLDTISEYLLSGLHSLQELYLDQNALRTVHQQAFRTAPNLEILELQHNQLSFVTEDGDDKLVDALGASPFQHLKRLRMLNLSQNSVSSILLDWTYITSALELLDLSHNKITHFGSQEMQFSSLHDVSVNLTHNEIEEINFTSLMFEQRSPRKTRTNIYLDQNPLKCDCLILRFIKYVQSQDTKPENMRMFLGDMKCAEPEAMHDKRVADVLPNELICHLDSPNSSNKLCPSGCDCFVRPEDWALIVNCSNANLDTVPNLPIPIYIGLNFTELYLENNQLVSLPNISHGLQQSIGYDFVVEIHAKDNNISQLHAHNIPANLQRLDVQHNHLTALNHSVLVAFNRTRTLNRISLGHNPWLCDCPAKDLLIFTQNHAKRIADMSHVRCPDGSRLQEYTVSDLCPQDHTIIIMACVMLTLLGLSVGLIVAFYFKYEQEVKVWLFAHNLLACLVTEFEVDVDKKYDAFVSYSHKDQDFVTDQLVPELEKGQTPFKLCLHERDWLVGGAITQSIAESVETSRRTLIVLTKNFVESDWGKMEFRVAHKKALSENRARVIVIVCGDIEALKTDSLGAEMKAYLETNTYIKWGDPWFWKKLRYAMPHANSYQAKRSQPPAMKKSSDNSRKGSMDDKLDLIKPVTPTMTTPPAEMASQKFLSGLNGSLSSSLNGHVNGAFIVNANAKQSDV